MFDLTVALSDGAIEGVRESGFSAFRGIPFAAPPLGPLRWKPPQPVTRWTDAKKTHSYAPAPPQSAMILSLMGVTVKASEDCLYLNVVTPAKSPSERLPVLVWIHGGGFAGGLTGFPLTDGEKLVGDGIVFVSIAYRVGPFGFLAHPELSRESGAGSGNAGLLDQLAGLEWVRDNIAKFGGDPSRVTIFGESAGGLSVSMLAASPLAKGLFARAICNSGASFAPGKFANEGGQGVWQLRAAEAFGKKFFESLGASDLAAARKLLVDEIQKAADPLPIGTFWPVIDGHAIVGDQYELYLEGRYTDTPVLIGWNSDEGAFIAQPGVTRASFEAEVKDGYDRFAESLLKVYPHTTDSQAALASKQLFRDTAFAWSTWAWARLQSRTGRGKVFLYHLDHKTPESPDGSNHGSDISYVFRRLEFLGQPRRPARPDDVQLSKRMSDYWMAFVKTGDPNHSGAPTWPAFSESQPQLMYFDGDTGASPVPDIDKLETLERYYAWRRDEVSKRK